MRTTAACLVGLLAACSGETGPQGEPGRDGRDAVAEPAPPPEKGDPGQDGIDGVDGMDGESIEGPEGPMGPPGPGGVTYLDRTNAPVTLICDPDCHTFDATGVAWRLNLTSGQATAPVVGVTYYSGSNCNIAQVVAFEFNEPVFADTAYDMGGIGEPRRILPDANEVVSGQNYASYRSDGACTNAAGTVSPIGDSLVLSLNSTSGVAPFNQVYQAPFRRAP